MLLRATPVTAAIAGILSAVLWPLAWTRYGGDAASSSIELVVATLLLIALPAHALVVGFGYRPAPGQGVDTALLQRVAAWLVAAGATLGVVALARAG